MISIEIDTISYAGLKDDFDQYGIAAGKAIMRAVLSTGLYIKKIAKGRLHGWFGSKKHIVTARLVTSVHMETDNRNTFKAKEYSEAGDGTFNTQAGALEAIVGTNVEYGPKIEFEYDQYLGFAALSGEKYYEERLIHELNNLKYKSMSEEIETNFDEYSE